MHDIRAEHMDMHTRFIERCAQLGVKVNPYLFWYHTVDLGDGLITPGSFDYRASIAEFGFPENMSGLRALDVGSASGFFAFEMERRGADVVSVEVAGMRQWDHFPDESPSQIITKMRDLMPHHSPLPAGEVQNHITHLSESEVYDLLLDHPFRFCHQRLSSKVRRLYKPIYDIASGLEPDARFDVVFLGDIILHLIDPLRGLTRASALCNDHLIICQEMMFDDNPQPLLYYLGGVVPDADVAQWWRPNVSWFQQVLKRLGFASVELTKRLSGTIRPGGEAFEKGIIHAFR